MPNALVFGEVLWDLYPNRKVIGGAPFNFAIHFALCGGQSYLVSAVGDDSLGLETKETVSAYRIPTDYIATVPDFPTGRCEVTLDGEGHPTYRLPPRQAYDRIPVPKDLAKTEWDLLSFGTLALREGENMDSLRAILASSHPHHVFVDINLRKPFYSPEVVQFALDQATILKVSDEELPTLLSLLGIQTESDPKSAIPYLATKYPQIALFVLTMGANGSFAYRSRDKASFYCPSVPVEVISTVGAGDSFGASFAYSFLLGKEIQECLSVASTCASETVSRLGAVPPPPERI